jgi:Ser/Thr protein kinase RdoA (MazF antagonist)
MEYPCDAATRGLLLDANSEALWFARAEQVPEYTGAHPDGELVWQTVRRLLPKARPVPPALVHIDYWPGNVLWHDD